MNCRQNRLNSPGGALPAPAPAWRRKPSPNLSVKITDPNSAAMPETDLVPEGTPAPHPVLPLRAAKKTEAAFAQFEFAPAVLALDAEGRIKFWTSAETRMFHRGAAETAGRPLAELGILLEDAGGQAGTPLRSAAQLGAEEARARVILPEGGTRWLGLRAVECGTHGGITLFVRDLGPELRHLRLRKLAALLRPAISGARGIRAENETLDRVRDFFGAAHAWLFDAADEQGEGGVVLAAEQGGPGIEAARASLEALLSDARARRRFLQSGVISAALSGSAAPFRFASQRIESRSGGPRLLVLARAEGASPWSAVDTAVLADSAEMLSFAFETARAASQKPLGNRYLESIMRSSDLGIVFAENRDGAIVVSLANRMFFEFFGSETAEFSGGRIEALEEHLLSCTADPASAREHLISHFEQGGERVGELTTKRPAYRILRIFSAPATDEGEVVGRIILFRDITRDKEIEQQLLHSQKMESIGTLAGGIAHDFNNLLTTMLGYAELLKGEFLPGHPSYTKIEQIERSARRAAELTSNLLAFSRRTPTQMTVCDIGELVREAVALVRFSVPSSIEIRTDIGANVPLVEADATQIQQVLINLMLNARDALPETGGRIAVSTRAGEDPMNPVRDGGPNYAIIEVQDNGCGISQESLPRIFEPFYTTKEVGKGTGLGLAMVYGIVKQHRGFIEVSSAPKTGSVFSVFLPETKKPRQPPAPPAETVEHPHKTGARILVVDDEPDLLEFCRSALEPVCGAVRTASDGLEALTLVEAAPDEFDLVILDLTMPRMGGIECFYRMRRVRPDMKIIISSGYSVEGGPENLLQSGAVAFLQKPYSVQSLLRTVKAQLAV